MQRSILAIELCVAFDPDLHDRLLKLVMSAPARLDYGAKWTRYRDAGAVLAGAADRWRSGCWDFWPDNEKALTDFKMWVNGMLTREGSRTEPSGTPDPYRGEARFLTFTMACVIEQGSASERDIEAACNIPKPQLWQRRSFERVLTGLSHLNFAVIEQDTMYLIPRDTDWCLTEPDLTAKKFEYLRPIEG